MEFDKQEEIRFISSGLEKGYKKLSEKERMDFVEKAVSFDEGYMKEMGFLDEEETDKDLIYDEDEAFDYILGEFYKTPEYRKWKDDQLEDLVDDFLELKYDYLLSKGLVE
jgi:hypothetical protein